MLIWGAKVAKKATDKAGPKAIEVKVAKKCWEISKTRADLEANITEIKKSKVSPERSEVEATVERKKKTMETDSNVESLLFESADWR